MQTLHYPIQSHFSAPRQVVVMGFFDGVHLGHQAVIQRGQALAKQYQVPLAVLTYDPHPTVVFQKAPERVRYLTTVDQKVEQLTTLGVDNVYVMNLTSRLASLPPQQFVDEVIMSLNPCAVVAGFDHTYGPKDATMADLPHYAQGRFEVVTVDKQMRAAEKISSTRIRMALANGDVTLAKDLLGRAHVTTGVVVHGEARGRELGFPTANIQTPELEWLPAIGIYAVRMKIGDEWFDGMASVGRNVTFGEGRPITVEIYLFDFQQAIYGEKVMVKWEYYLRGEVKFTSVDALIDQLHEDERDARHLLKGNS